MRKVNIWPTIALIVNFDTYFTEVHMIDYRSSIIMYLAYIATYEMM